MIDFVKELLTPHLSKYSEKKLKEQYSNNNFIPKFLFEKRIEKQ